MFVSCKHNSSLAIGLLACFLTGVSQHRESVKKMEKDGTTTHRKGRRNVGYGHKQDLRRLSGRFVLLAGVLFARMGPTPSFEGTLKGYLEGTLNP